LNNLQKD